MAIEITSYNFEEEILKSELPVLIDFGATWCGPCKMIAPIIEEISQDFKDKIKVGKINIDKQKDLAQRYKIMSIPTLMLFKDGNSLFKQVGTMSKEEIVSLIDEAI